MNVKETTNHAEEHLHRVNDALSVIQMQFLTAEVARDSDEHRCQATTKLCNTATSSGMDVISTRTANTAPIRLPTPSATAGAPKARYMAGARVAPSAKKHTPQCRGHSSEARSFACSS